jgi:hypothetical protein
VFSKRNIMAVYGISCIGAYLVTVVILSLLKASTGLIYFLSWAEVFYYPPITLGSCFMIFAIAYGIECWFKRKV